MQINKPYSHLIFDWDGTVMDSAAKIVSCMQMAAKACGLTIPTDKDVRQIIGISLLPAIAQLFSIQIKDAQRVAEHYKHIFLESDKTPSPLFEGAISTLTQLSQNYVLGVATGKARRGLNRAWQQTNSGHLFDQSRCADDAESKPSPDMLVQLMEHWQIEASDALMIGDTVYDMQMAEAIGMDRLGVSYGVHEANALKKHGPIAIIDRFDELHTHLL
ncbi:HAD-IA family hydrolase [Ningiella sp. W23]|uniref:HAD-IA family hydrolase n=1 Tax=Ningiella sp. W23 TaxID=3023715 RepID=UPI0037573DA6